MRFIIMHRTTAQWEADVPPSPELIAKVGSLLGDLAQKGKLLGGEGLRASSYGVRLRFSGGKRSVTKGPFRVSTALPAGFAILRVASVEDAMAWSTRFAEATGVVEVDVRPVTEEWDIGMGPPPAELSTRRWMALYKTEPGHEDAFASARAAAAPLVEESAKSGILLVHEAMQPSAKGARLTRSGERFVVTDGPFTEAKELVAGYGLVEVASRAEAIEIALKYAPVVGTDEVDVRPLAG